MAGWQYFTPLLTTLKNSFALVFISISAAVPNIKFKIIFKAALLAEVVFIIAQMICLINLSFHLDTVRLETASNYHPLTVLSYFGMQNVTGWFEYPLQTLNLFEVFYMAVIAWLLAEQWKHDFTESLAVVLPSYGTGLISLAGAADFLNAAGELGKGLTSKV